VLILETERLLLRPFDLSDAETVQRLASDWEVASMVPSIPHPYPDGAAESWIHYLKQASEKGNEIGFAIVRRVDNALIGSISLMINKTHQKGEIGYWLGREYWGNGYATEACKKIIEFGFCELKLNRLFAPVMTRNAASARVLGKAGLKYEGTARQSLLIRGVFEDIATFGLVKSEYSKTVI
jgi:RimJ/RimL family protein N-acetyltransferase